jgi:hypothetical protein
MTRALIVSILMLIYFTTISYSQNRGTITVKRNNASIIGEWVVNNGKVKEDTLRFFSDSTFFRILGITYFTATWSLDQSKKIIYLNNYQPYMISENGTRYNAQNEGNLSIHYEHIAIDNFTIVPLKKPSTKLYYFRHKMYVRIK